MKDKFVPVCKKKCRVWGVGDDGIAPPTVNLDMFYRDENLASRLSSCTHEGSPVALNRRLSGLHSRSGRFGEHKINWTCRESNRDCSIVQFLACNRCSDGGIPRCEVIMNKLICKVGERKESWHVFRFCTTIWTEEDSNVLGGIAAVWLRFKPCTSRLLIMC
jgi:hypothetical protein